MISTNSNEPSHGDAYPKARRRAVLFATPLEVGLRSLIVLAITSPSAWSLQRLVAYDYLLVHSADAGGPESLHPSTPHRSSEILVKRDVLREGLRLMLSRDLVRVAVTSYGVLYGANTLTPKFLEYLEDAYTLELQARARWIGDQFSTWSDERLSSFMRENLGRWGGEFTSEARVRDVAI